MRYKPRKRLRFILRLFMTRVQRLAREIEELTSEEFRAFRRWFQEFDAAVWDEQIERDAAAGRLDKLAEKALRDHRAGKTRQM